MKDRTASITTLSYVLYVACCDYKVRGMILLRNLKEDMRLDCSIHMSVHMSTYSS